ncbi:MAG TPA: thioredoxin-dependent thiol peroxidase [Anaerolineaceae bacterium]|nr:thioredoxin-dependent thiol peroxidase [Anaerolineaceae bacterium]
MTITVGANAPQFSLPDENGTLHQLSDYLGRWVVLYFYPKDDTPGCTTEACGFRDQFADYEHAGVVVLGVSPDGVKSHARFKAKHALPFTLLSDEGHQICEVYGCWGRKKFMGREYDGVLRTTFLISPAGLVHQVFENVKPDGHSAQVLAAIRTD